MKNILVLICFSIFFYSCFWSKLNGADSRLYKSNFEDSGILEISNFKTSERTVYFLKLSNSMRRITMEIVDRPSHIVIDKRISTEPGITYRLVTDTLGCQLKSLNYTFLPQYSTCEILKSFSNISDQEVGMLNVFSQVLKKKHSSLQISKMQVDKFLGWVTIIQ